MATTITMAEFQVDLSAMKAAIDQLKTLSGKVEDDLNDISAKFNAVKGSWQSPSADSFDAVQAWFMQVSAALHALLEDATTRLNTAYGNYLTAEEAAYNNVT